MLILTLILVRSDDHKQSGAKTSGWYPNRKKSQMDATAIVDFGILFLKHNYRFCIDAWHSSSTAVAEGRKDSLATF